MSGVTVLIVEDQDQFRQMLCIQLGRYPELDILGEAANGDEAIEMAEKLKPQVVLMDIELGDGPNGIQAGRTIRAVSPSTGIVLLSSHNDKQFLAATLEEEHRWSYLLKKNVRNLNSVVQAIVGSSWGKAVVDPALIDGLKPRADTPSGRLTEEQVKVLELVARGDSDGDIAVKLNLDHGPAIPERLAEIYSVLGITQSGTADPRVEALRAYLEQTRGD